MIKNNNLFEIWNWLEWYSYISFHSIDHMIYITKKKKTKMEMEDCDWK